jgi:hypothetical protein
VNRLRVGVPWPARIGKGGRSGAIGRRDDAQGSPTARVRCGYASCSADVASVWPALPAGDRPSPGDLRRQVVAAGLRLAAPREWPTGGVLAPPPGAEDRRHRVDFLLGLVAGPDGVFRLSGHAERRWRRARRLGVRWHEFEPHERRQRGPGQGFRDLRALRRLRSRTVVPASDEGPLLFRCPVCDRVNAAAVPARCPDDCPLHTLTAPLLEQIRHAVWWWPIAPKDLEEHWQEITGIRL